MRRQLKTVIALCYALLLSTAFQCGDNEEPVPTCTFKEEVKLYPEQKSYLLGDTIWLEYQNPSRMLVNQ